MLCLIGSFTEQKNHLFMLDAMRYLPEEFHLILLGEEGVYDAIVNKINQMKLNNRVHLLGFRSDVASIIKTCDLVVIPSKWEGFGLVAVEAMACGKQVVCLDILGLSEIVGDGGIKVHKENPKEYAAAIIQAKLQLGDKNIVNCCMKQARKYDIERMKQKYFNIYNMML